LTPLLEFDEFHAELSINGNSTTAISIITNKNSKLYLVCYLLLALESIVK